MRTSAMPEKIYWFDTKSTGQNFEIYWSDLSDLSHVCIGTICGQVGWEGRVTNAS